MKDFMKEALILAQKAYKKGEVPIGAVIVKNGQIISKGFNKREKSQNALNHAEIIAIRKACKKEKSWRLENCQMYVTLEPCPMCAGAILNARLKDVFYACKEKTSNSDLCKQILESDRLNHHTNLVFMPEYETESANLLTTFFKSKRKIKSNKK